MQLMDRATCVILDAADEEMTEEYMLDVRKYGSTANKWDILYWMQWMRR